MNKIAIIIVCLALLLLGFLFLMPNALSNKTVSNESSTTSENFTSWQEFIPKTELFKVMLPHTPQYAKDLVAIPNSDKKRRYDIYVSEKIDGTLFLISVINYPDDVAISSSTEMAKSTIEELMKSRADNQLVKLGDPTDQNGTDFVIENKEFHIQGKVFMDGKTVYIVDYITILDNFDPDEYRYFIDSFKLLKKNSEKAQK